MKHYDFVIVGSGMGGLSCGAILSNKGFKVCILEKNAVIGGCLQSYYKNGDLYETGVHYIGSLDEGQILNRIFKYFGIMDLVEFERMNQAAFDKFSFGDNPELFFIPQGYSNYIETLSKRFPEEKEGIMQYCKYVVETCHKFPLYTFKPLDIDDKHEILKQNAAETIGSFVKNPLLRNILAGNNSLYAGSADKTPFYIHALIENSFIESSWKCKRGGSSIAEALVKVIKRNHGEIITNAEVVRMDDNGTTITNVVTKSGEVYSAEKFISSIHPSVTLSLTTSHKFRPIYRKRIAGLENTTSSFSVNIKFKPDSFPYLDFNHYYHSADNVWNSMIYEPSEWPKAFVLFTATKYDGTNMARTGSILTYMNFSDVQKWENTFNTVQHKGTRGDDYEQFKQEKALRLIELTETKYPGIKDAIEEFHTTTPLTFRDYFNTPNGSLYGIVKNCNETINSYFPSKTKIPNLFFTGQNLSVHGVLGVAMSAVVTCGEFIGIETIFDELRKI